MQARARSGKLGHMPDQGSRLHTVSPPCRWRTSDETLDVIEALERIEALLSRLDERLKRIEASAPPPIDPAEVRSAATAGQSLPSTAV